MRLSNPSSSDLGTYTWSQLQTAFPNGGAALAALPYSATAIVTDIGKAACKVTPNLAKTRWVPINGQHILCQAAGTVASPIVTWAGATGQYAWPGGNPSVPANVLAAGDMFNVMALTRRRNANGSAVFRVRFGSTGTYNTDAQIAAAVPATVDKRDSWISMIAAITASTVAIPNSTPQGSEGTNTTLDSTTNFSIASAMYLSVEVTTIHASDFFDLIFFQMIWGAA